MTYESGLLITRQFGLIKHIKKYKLVQCIYLVYRWRNQNAGPFLTLTVRCERKKKTILSELQADNIEAVYDRLRESTSFKMLDLRERPALD